jgi:capsular exopolysaccharide synthesis family protein
VAAAGEGGAAASQGTETGSPRPEEVAGAPEEANGGNGEDTGPRTGSRLFDGGYDGLRRRLREYSHAYLGGVAQRLKDWFRQGSAPTRSDAIFARRASGARFASVHPEGRQAPEICFDMPPGVQEEYERIRANLLGSARGAEARVFVVAASVSGEGATTSSVFLGMTFAQDAPTILIDGNLRTPALGKIFHADDAHGLADILTNDVPLATCVRETPIPNLFVLAGGTAPIRPHLLFRNSRLPTLLRELQEHFTYVIFDCAPLNSYSEGIYLARQVDGVVMVVHAETTPIEVAYLAKMQVERSGAKVLGALLTKKREYLPEALSRRL